MATAKPFRFDKATEDLERLVEQLESGSLSLEKALETFEKGVKLTRECQKALQSAEQKVQILMKSEGMEVFIGSDGDDEPESD